MATIKTVLSIQDAMTKPLRSINRAMNLVISSMEQMQKATRKPVDTKALKENEPEIYAKYVKTSVSRRFTLK